MKIYEIQLPFLFFKLPITPTKFAGGKSKGARKLHIKTSPIEEVIGNICTKVTNITDNSRRKLQFL